MTGITQITNLIFLPMADSPKIRNVNDNN